jgi:hypothetical protein
MIRESWNWITVHLTRARHRTSQRSCDAWFPRGSLPTATPKIYCKPQWSNSEIRASLHRRRHTLDESVPGLGGYDHEIVIRLRRTLGCRYPVNRIAVRPRRPGSAANRHLASQRHGRSAEANGEAATAGGNATRVRSGGTPSGPDIASHSNGDWDWDWDAVGCAGACHDEACPARERGQQLQRWLRIKLQTRQGPLGRMQRVGGVLLNFLSNLQRHTHPQGLRAMRRNQNVPGLGPTTILVVLHRHAGWREISGHRGESKQVAHAYRGSIADS